MTEIEVEGLKRFQRELRKLDGLPGLKKLNREVSELVVAEGEKELSSALGALGQHVVRQNSIRPSSAAGKVTVRLGGTAKKHGPAYGAEFGALKYSQFPVWRGNGFTDGGFGGGTGYGIHPAIRNNRQRILKIYGDGLDRLASDAFPER